MDRHGLPDPTPAHEAGELSGWLERISQVHPGSMALSLDRVGEVYRRMGSPAPAPRTITVGGTNGKGSSTALLSALLRSGGLRVGRSTSPHLFLFNERVQIDDCPVADEHLIGAFETIDRLRGEILLTYFEYATLAAIHLFAAAEVDVAVLEVGLGGRLDAVNVVPADAALVTSIGFDHQRWLGDSLAQIAREKAGIFKPGRIAVSASADAPPELEQIAEEQGAFFFKRGRDFDLRDHGQSWDWWCANRRLEGLPLPALAGRHQLSNAAGCLMVLQALDLLEQVADSLDRGLRTVHLPGRLWQVASDPAIVLDVAHNQAAAQSVADWLRACPCSGRTWLVLGMLKDKQPAAFAEAFAGAVDQLLLAGLPPPRGLSGRALASALGPTRVPAAVFPDLAEALQDARSRATPQDRIIVTGSFISVMQAARILGAAEIPGGKPHRGEFSERRPG